MHPKKYVQKKKKKRTNIKIQHMVWNNTNSSFTCSQPTSSKCMVPAAPHTAVQFALCSEPLNPTRQKARRGIGNGAPSNKSYTPYLFFSMCIQKSMLKKREKEKDKHKKYNTWCGTIQRALSHAPSQLAPSAWCQRHRILLCSLLCAPSR